MMPRAGLRTPTARNMKGVSTARFVGLDVSKLTLISSLARLISVLGLPGSSAHLRRGKILRCGIDMANSKFAISVLTRADLGNPSRVSLSETRWAAEQV